MSVQVETLEKNMAKLTIEVSEDKVEEALNSGREKCPDIWLKKCSDRKSSLKMRQTS